MKCRQFRIEKWLYNKTIVYTPQIKKLWYWNDLKTPNSGLQCMSWERGWVQTEGEAREIIEKYKKDEGEATIFERDCKLARRRFKKEQKFICVE
jgi:hypothetical protein